MTRAAWMVVVAIACAVAGPVAPAGAFDAGLTEMRVVDPVSGEVVPVALWYPAEGRETRMSFGPFRIRAALGAPVAAGPHGLVVISHGSGGSHLVHRGLAGTLARNGWFAAAPLHPGDNFMTDAAAGTRAVLEGRPRTVSEVVDAVIDDGRFGRHVDDGRIAVVGYSMGGATALALLGAVPSRDAARAHCRSHPEDGFCAVGPEPGASGAGDGPIEGLADPRFRAAVLLAPNTAWFPDSEIEAVGMPVLIYAAERDEQLRTPYHAARIGRLLGPGALMRVIDGAVHYSFLAPFPEHLHAELGPVAEDPSGFDRVAAHARMDQEIVDFLDRVVR